MHSAFQLLVIWGLAFITLSAALVLLNIYYGVIGNDLVLRSLGQEAAIAAAASLVEGASVWLVISFAPTASRALFIPALIVAIIYKLAHLEDWSRYDILMFMAFQLVIVFSGSLLFSGHFQAALILLVVFGAFLAILGNIVKGL